MDTSYTLDGDVVHITVFGYEGYRSINPILCRQLMRMKNKSKHIDNILKMRPAVATPKISLCVGPGYGQVELVCVGVLDDTRVVTMVVGDDEEVVGIVEAVFGLWDVVVCISKVFPKTVVLVLERLFEIIIVGAAVLDEAPLGGTSPGDAPLGDAPLGDAASPLVVVSTMKGFVKEVDAQPNEERMDPNSGQYKV